MTVREWCTTRGITSLTRPALKKVADVSHYHRCHLRQGPRHMRHSPRAKAWYQRWERYRLHTVCLCLVVFYWRAKYAGHSCPQAHIFVIGAKLGIYCPISWYRIKKNEKPSISGGVEPFLRHLHDSSCSSHDKVSTKTWKKIAASTARGVPP